jgi:hypothetical protein
MVMVMVMVMDIDTGTGSGNAGFAHPLLAWPADVGAGVDAAMGCPTLSLPLGEYESAVRQIAVYARCGTRWAPCSCVSTCPPSRSCGRSLTRWLVRVRPVRTGSIYAAANDGRPTRSQCCSARRSGSRRADPGAGPGRASHRVRPHPPVGEDPGRRGRGRRGKQWCGRSDRVQLPDHRAAAVSDAGAATSHHIQRWIDGGTAETTVSSSANTTTPPSTPKAGPSA